MKLNSVFLAAALDPGTPDSVHVTPLHRKLMTGAMPVLLVGMVLLLGFFIWAMFLRTHKRPHQRGRLVEGPVTPRSLGASGRRRRRRREQKRPRNPTLAETGGLPPTRSDTDLGPDPKP